MTLDKKLGFQYSDRFSIRAMREEIFSIMKSARHGSYTRFNKAPRILQQNQSSKFEPHV